MVTEAQRDQIERRATLDNDRRVRAQEQTGTYFSHTHDDAFGRWREHGAAFVVGSTAVPQYPASTFQSDPVPDEPPTGERIDDMIPVGPDFSLVQGQGPASS